MMVGRFDAKLMEWVMIGKALGTGRDHPDMASDMTENSPLLECVCVSPEYPSASIAIKLPVA